MAIRGHEVTDRSLPVHRVAQILSCSRSHVYELISRGLISATRIGGRHGVRVPEKSLSSFIASRETGPKKMRGSQRNCPQCP